MSSIMRLLTSTKAVGVTLALASATTAHAQSPIDLPSRPSVEREPWVRVGLGGGLSVPTRDAQDALKTGVNGQGFVLVRLAPGLPPLRFTFNYQKFNLKPTIGGATDGSHQALGGLGGISVDLLHGPVRPYVTAGLGAFNVRNVLNMASGSTQTSSGTNWGIDGGAGLAIRIGRLSAFAEGHVQNVYAEHGLIDKKSIQSVPVSFGLLF